MVSWDNQSQQMSQTDFTEWMFVRRSVTSLVLMGCAPGGRHTKCGGGQSSLRGWLGQSGAAMGGQSTDREQRKLPRRHGGFVKTSQNDIELEEREGRTD